MTSAKGKKVKGKVGERLYKSSPDKKPTERKSLEIPHDASLSPMKTAAPCTHADKLRMSCDNSEPVSYRGARKYD